MVRNVRKRNVRRARPREATVTEKAFMSQVVELLELYGWRSYHTFDSRRSTPGFPDLVAIKGKRLLAIEVKTETGKVTDEQYAWLAAFAGVSKTEALVLRPENVDEFTLIVAG